MGLFLMLLFDLLSDCIDLVCIDAISDVKLRKPADGRISPIWLFLGLVVAGLLLLLYLRPVPCLMR